MSNHQILLEEAIAMTSRYRQTRPGNYPTCETFSKEVIEGLLGTTDAAFLRIYYGLKENGEMDVILVAADAAGADILPSSGNTTAVILEDSFRCPPICPPASPLNIGNG